MRNYDVEGLRFEQVVEAAFELGGAIAPDRATAAELATRHLERVLVRGRNAHLLVTLKNLARELEPTTNRRAPRGSHRGRSVHAA